MKHCVLLTFIILFTPFFIFAQQIQPLWERTEATDGSTGTQYRPLPIVVVDIFHNVIVCGETYHPGPLKGFVTTKYDSSGNFLWKRTYDVSGQDIITAVVTDNAGAVYVGGSTTNPFTNKAGIRIIKYASDGDTLWQYSPPVESSSYFTPSALLLDPVQNLIVFSNFIDVASNNSGLMVTKLDQNGETIWESYYDEGDYGYIGLDARWVGDHLVFWGQTGSAEGTRFFMWQISGEGETEDTATTEPYTLGFGSAYHIDAYGNLFIGRNAYEYEVTKFTSNGMTDWSYKKPITFPPPNASQVDLQCITTDSAGFTYISGRYYNGDSLSRNCITTKLSNSGEVIWEHEVKFDGRKIIVPNVIQEIKNDLYLVTGVARISLDSNFYEPFLAFYNQDGCVKTGISDISGHINDPVSIAVDGSSFYIAGMSFPIIFLSEPNAQFLCKYALDDIITSIAPAGAANSMGRITFSPNPFHINFQATVYHIGKATQGLLEIRDLQGREVMSKNVSLVSGENAFDFQGLDKLSPGVYNVTIVSAYQLYVGQVVKTQ